MFPLAVLSIFILGVGLRVIFAPNINLESDSFSLLLSARNIYENGQYSIPPIALTDDDNHPRYTGWAVGYPLLLAGIFAIFGYGEGAARLFTIVVAALPIIMVALLGKRLDGWRMGIIAGLLVAVNPILVCVNGRILSANIAYAFLTMSIACALLAAVQESGDEVFVPLHEILCSRRRTSLVCLAMFFFACTLSTRDDYVIFAPVLVLILFGVLYQSRSTLGITSVWEYIRASAIACGSLVVGYCPNMYFNYKNYGKVIASTGLEYGLRLSLDYFISGNNALYHLPGGVIIIVTLLVFVAPAVSVVFLWRSRRSRVIGAVLGLMVVAVVAVYGSFSTSIGGSGRYIIPVIPFALIAAAGVVACKGLVSRGTRVVFITCLILWNVALFYPPTVLFEIAPKAAHIAHYVPWYNKANYINYPHPIVATVDWVRDNTPSTAIILSDYDNYHYYFYANRQVMSTDAVDKIARYASVRPMYLIEDHQRVINRDVSDEWLIGFRRWNITVTERQEIPFFSPAVGKQSLKIYELSSSGANTTVNSEGRRIVDSASRS